jgi:hypothetical protein
MWMGGGEEGGMREKEKEREKVGCSLAIRPEGGFAWVRPQLPDLSWPARDVCARVSVQP